MADTSRDFDLRKKQAADALREMSSRAKAQSGNSFKSQNAAPPPIQPAAAASGVLPINLNFSRLDNDTLLILGILLILSGENTDKLLLLALCYILI